MWRPNLKAGQFRHFPSFEEEKLVQEPRKARYRYV